MAGRWAAFAMLLAMLAIVGIFLWPVIRQPAPVASGPGIMAMDAERIALVQEGSGFWHGTGRLSMAGRWNLQVELNGETVNVPFEVGSR